MLSLAAKIELEEGKIVRVMGPANIHVEQGKIRILGIDFEAGSRALIHRFRSYAVKAVEKSIISVTLGEGGGIEEPSEGEEVIDVWESVAQEIITKGDSVVVIGPVDSGKSSFSLLISNIALDQGLKPAIVDADIGQGDLAPPGFIAMKIMDKKSLWLREIRGEVLRLIGAITPTIPFAATRLLYAINDLVRIARQEGAKPIIVNTDGWVNGFPAIDFKLSIIRAVKPTHVVVLDDAVCQRISIALRGTCIDVKCVPRPKVVRERDRADRRLLRRQHYQSFFTKAKRVCLNLSEISIVGSCLFSGSILSEALVQEILKDADTCAMISIHDDLVAVAVDEVRNEVIQRLRERFHDKELYIIDKNSVRGLLAAILDEKLEERAPALIESLDLKDKRICVYTEYEGTIKGLFVSRIKLSDEWEEVGRISKCPI